MKTQVEFEDRPVGEIGWTADAYGVTVELDCTIPCEPLVLLRCYAETDGAPFLVGLPEPLHGRLRLRRHLSRETLREAGLDGRTPARFYLAERPEAPRTLEKPPSGETPQPRMGDAVLDALLAQGSVRAERTETGVRLTCAFGGAQPFALAPAFVLCRVENGAAILDWTQKGAADAAAPLGNA